MASATEVRSGVLALEADVFPFVGDHGVAVCIFVLEVWSLFEDLLVQDLQVVLVNFGAWVVLGDHRLLKLDEILLFALVQIPIGYTATTRYFREALLAVVEIGLLLGNHFVVCTHFWWWAYSIALTCQALFQIIAIYFSVIFFEIVEQHLSVFVVQVVS